MSGFLVNKSLLDPTVTQYSGGTASFTLPQSGSTNATEVFVGGVPQVAGVDFNVSGTALTLTTSAPAGANMVCARQYFADGITGTPASNSVATATVQDNAINLAKMAGGTDGNIISFDASGDPVYIATGDDGQVLTSAGVGAQPAFETLSAGFTQTAITATTSGTSHTISGIPSGTKLIYFIINGVNFTGHLDMDITIGDSGGLETSGYTSVSQESNLAATLGTTAGGTGSKWELYNSNSTSDYAMLGVGMIHLVNPSTFLYNFNYQGGRGRGLTLVSMTGDKTLSSEITQINIAGGTFDEGQFCLMYI